METPEILQNSKFLKELKQELEEINLHKYYESEKLGYDIGFQKALISWLRFHKKQWKKNR